MSGLSEILSELDLNETPKALPSRSERAIEREATSSAEQLKSALRFDLRPRKDTFASFDLKLPGQEELSVVAIKFDRAALWQVAIPIAGTKWLGTGASPEAAIESAIAASQANG